MPKKSVLDVVQNNTEENAGLVSAPKSVLDVIAPSAIEGESKVNSEDRNKFSVFKSVDFNPNAKEFEYVTNPSSKVENLDKISADSQPLWDKFTRMGKQFGAGLLTGVANSALTTLDVEQSVKTVAGISDDYSNSLIDAVNEWHTGVVENNPITEQRPGKINPSDPGWWAKNIAETGFSAGIAVESLLETFAIDAATAGIGGNLKLASLGKIFETSSNVERLKRNASIFGIVRRHHEGMMEAKQSFDEKYKELIDEGVTEDKAKDLASKGAAFTYRANLPLMALDAMMFRAMVFNPVSGKASGAIENLLGKVSNKYARGAAAFGINMAGEGAEEMWQYVAQEEGKNYVDYLAGHKTDENFSNRLKGYLKKDDFWNAGVSGVFGGLILGGAFKGYEKLTSGAESKRLEAYHSRFINDLSGITTEMNDNLRASQEAGDEAKSTAIRREMAINKALTALHLDALTDKDTAFSGYTNFLQSTLNNVESEESQELDKEYIKTHFPKLIEDANKLQSIYDTVKDQHGKTEILPVAYRHFALNNLVELQPQIAQKALELRALDNNYNLLSEFGKNIIDNRYEGVTETETANTVLRDQNYTEALRNSDTPILDSYIFDGNRLAATRELKQINDAISKLRTEIAQYNNPDFVKEQRKKVIANSRSVAQVEEVADDIVADNQMTEAIAETIEDKKSEIEARDIAASIGSTNQVITEPVDDPFGIVTPEVTVNPERAERGATISSATQAAMDDSSIPVANIDFFDPAVLNSQLNENTKSILQGETALYVSSLADELGRTPMFEDYVKDFIKTQGITTAENLYNGLVKGWELNNFVPSDYSKVYNNIFRNRESIGRSITDAISAAIQTPQDVIETTVATEDILEEETPPVDFNSDNQPIYVNSSNTTHETSPKLAFVSIAAKLNLDKQEDAYYVSYEDLDGGLNEGQYVNSIRLLNPDSFLPGTQLKMSVPSNYLDIEIPVYNNDGTKNKSIPFGQYAAENNLDASSQEYKDKIPMFISDINGPVAFVHDAGWYHPIRFQETEVGQMEEAIENTRKMREAALNGNTNITITSKRATTFQGLIIPDNKPKITTKEAAPESVIAVATSDSILSIGSKKPFTGVVIGSKGFEIGKTYSIRRWGTNEDGEKTYVAFAVTPMPVEDEAKTSVLEAMKNYLTQFNQGLTADQRKSLETLREQLKNQTGLDIHNKQDFDDYISQFVHVLRGNNINTPDDVVTLANSKLKTGEAYMFIDKSGNIIFGEVGFQMMRGKAALSLGPNIYKSNNPTTSNFVRNAFTIFSDRIISKLPSNTSVRNLSSTKPVVHLNATGTKIAASNYSEFVKERTLTNVRSLNIGTEDSPVWISNVQPIITYDLNSNLTTESSVTTNEEALQIAIGPVSTVDNTIAADYLLTGGIGTILSTDYLLKGISGVFTNAGNIIDNIRNKYAQELADTNQVDIKNFIGTDLYNTILTEIKDALSQSYNDAEVQNIFNDVMKFPTGMPNRVGNEIESRLNNLSKENEVPQLDMTEEEINSVISQSNKDLNWLGNDDFLLDPTILSEEQVSEAIQNNVRIAGLTPSQQYYLTDFIFNQIVTLVDFDTRKAISVSEIDKTIKNEYNAIVGPIKEHYVDQKNKLQEIYNSNPAKYPGLLTNISRYDVALNKIQAIDNEFDKFKQLAKAKVAKYTGISEVESDYINIRPDENFSEENPDDDTNLDTEIDSNERDSSFSSDALQEDGKKNSSYRLKRFMAGIKEYRKEGETNKPVTSFLNLPVFTSFDVVYNTLAANLANVGPDYNLMITKLKEVKGHLWMEDLINKLENSSEQIKNEFVSTMNKHALEMEFVMYGYDKKSDKYSLRVFKTNANSVTQTIIDNWYNNFKGSLVTLSEGVYEINNERAKVLLNQYNSWLDNSLKLSNPNSLNNPLFFPTLRQVAVTGSTEYITIKEPKLLKELQEKTDKGLVTVNVGKQDFQITKGSTPDTFNVSKYVPTKASADDVRSWLRGFGISISDETLNTLVKSGLTHNNTKVPFNNLFTDPNGLFRILSDRLKDFINKGSVAIEEEGGNPLDDSVVRSLAALEAKFASNVISNSFRDNGKSIYGYTANKFITDRVIDLKYNTQLRNQLGKLSFSKGSMWLDMLNDEVFSEKFSVIHLGLNAFKELGKQMYKENGVTSLADSDHELVKLGLFQDMQQGDSNYSIHGIPTRIARVFSPTMSDKSTMIILKTAVLNLKNKDFNTDLTPGDPLKRVIYEQTIKPELERMVKFYSEIKSTNIKSYDKGAGLFLMMPQMNNLHLSDNTRLIDAIKADPGTFTVDYVEEKLMGNINGIIDNYIKDLVAEKIEVWKSNGYFKLGDNETITGTKFFNSAYIDNNSKFTGDINTRVKLAASDYVINNLISNSNSFMVLAGDPAIYYKKEGSTNAYNYSQIVKDTFVNVGKRLANQIAPGINLADSLNNQYTQVFLGDRESAANNITYLERLLGKEEANSYRNIESTDAQEYTTWKEHLYILEKLGRTPDVILDVTPEDIRVARELVSTGKKIEDMSDKEKQILNQVFQPMKPVYTGQIFDETQDVMRTMYIKSSSFPLIPQLTQGLELESLRVAMEDFETKSNKTVRASYQTANKVGAMTSPLKIWDENGASNELVIDDTNSMILDRKNFRIQQDVPFKSGVKTEDKISLGTQTMKLLFGDGMLLLDGFEFKGKSYSGKDLHKVYNQLFNDLISYNRLALFNELGIDPVSKEPVDFVETAKKMQDILQSEASLRGYPKQDLEALNIVEKKDAAGNITGVHFNLPLWSAANSNRYESLLNAIVTNRLIKMKFPGNSYVLGSEEGFKFRKDLQGIDQNKIVFTDAWTGEIEPAEVIDGKLRKAQVLVASKFRDSNGKLIDLTSSEYSKRDENGVLKLDQSKISKDLLSLTSFRIPTSGHMSMSEVEIVGFLPAENADLMIVPKNFTKQMGADFDIDKQNTYQLWHKKFSDGTILALDEIYDLAELDDIIKETKAYYLETKARFNTNAINQSKIKIIEDDAIEGELGSFAEAKDKLNKLKAKEGLSLDEFEYKEAYQMFKDASSPKLRQKLIQNEIIRIHRAVLSNPSDEVQTKIQRTLSIDFAKAQAAFIDGMIQNKSETKTIFTPLSDEYQKKKMMLGSAGKIGTGAYSLDVVGHSLFQQANLTGNPIQLNRTEITPEGFPYLVPANLKFGNIVSKGILGLTNTLDGSRTIAEVNGERQNIAVDNEKEQVMGRVNLNDLTLDVDKVFNLLGFDKGEDGNSIAFLFLSQPIIIDFINELKNSKSTIAEFDANAEAKIIDALLLKYKSKTLTDEEMLVAEEMFTNKNFISNIESNEPDGFFQGAVLNRFLEMRDYGVLIKGLQTSINTDSKGLGKSFFDVIDKREKLNRLGDGKLTDASGKSLTGASSLIGDYQTKLGMSSNNIDLLISQGYTDIGAFMVKPLTLTGSFNILSVSSAYDLWNNYFPYDASQTGVIFKELIDVTGKDQASDKKKVELRQSFFQEMKKFLYSKQNLNLYSGDIQSERERLFFDGDEKSSLASYIKNLKDQNNEAIKANKMINRFSFVINTNREPSLIKFNNSASEGFDEDYLYNSFSEMIEKEIPLPQFNGLSYNTRMLAQDLIAYAYVEGGIQQAIQFVKYVPVDYLNAVGFSNVMNNIDFENSNIFGVRNYNRKDSEGHLVSRFTVQYAQHNPQKMPKMSIDDLKLQLTDTNSDYNGKIETLGEFQLKDDIEDRVFISVYNPEIPKGNKKFQLYWFDGLKYQRLPVLGTFGMDEYNIESEGYQSLTNGQVKRPISQSKGTSVVADSMDSHFDLDTKNITTIMNNIADSNLPVSAVAAALVPYLEDIKIDIDNIETLTGKKGNGLYNKPNNIITIDSNFISRATPEELSRVITHEVVHALTVNYINKNLGETGNLIDSAPEALFKLNVLFNEAVRKIGKEKIATMRASLLEGQAIDATLKNQAYGGMNMYEFLAEIMTNPIFQEEMSKHKFKALDVSLFERFKQIVLNILSNIGVKFDSESITNQAISSIFELLESKNNQSSNPFGEFLTPNGSETDFYTPSDEEVQKQLNICK